MKKIFFGIILLLFFLVSCFFAAKNLLPSSSKNNVKNSFLSTLSIILTVNNTVKFENPKKNFSRQEKPQFEIAIPYKSGSDIGKSKVNAWNIANEKINVIVKKLSTNTVVPAVIYKKASGKFAVVLDNKEKNAFGKYTITVTAKESFVYERNLSQDFNWGVLAINTNKSIYLPNETARLGFGVLDERGNTLCGAKLNLVISDPDNNKQNLSTENGLIKKNPKCFGNYYSLEEDYTANYKTGKTGRYYLNLTAETNNGPYTISDYFEVRDSVPFDIERTQFPSRIYPVDSYPVKLTIKADEDYKGKVYDLVPIDFQITDISGGGKVSRTKSSSMSLKDLTSALKDEAVHLGEKGYKIKYNPKDISKIADKTPVEVMWNVDWKKGNTYVLTYSIYFPQVSPEYYLLGPFTVGSFKEVRDWQVASDATKCWTGSGANNNWNTTGNWAGGTNPTSTSNATFHGASCTTGTPDKSVTVNVDPTLTGTGGGITLSSNYTGTMTQSSGIAMTINGTIGFVMAGGTFVGGDSTITTSKFNHTSGSFTSTSGTLSFVGNFTNSGGSFTHNSGTVYLNDGGASTYTFTGSTTLYNFSLYGAANNGVTLAIASGTTITVNNTLTLNSDDFCGSLLGIDGPGGISAKGDITLVNDGGTGTAIITLNGTGSQTIAGDGSAPVGGCSGSHNNQLPNITINKSSGGVTVQYYIKPLSWIFTAAGSVNTTGSTIIFGQGDNNVYNISGSMTFNNLTFYGYCNNGAEFDIASGTNLKVTGTLSLLSDSGALCLLGVYGPGTIEAQGDIVSGTNGVTGDVAITLTGSNDQTLTLNGTYFPSGNVTISKTGGSAIAASSLPFNNTGQSLAITSGTLNLASYNLTVNSTFTIGSSGTLKLQGGETVTTPTTISAGGTVEYNGAGTYSSLAAGSNYSNLTISGSGSFTPAANITVSGNFTQSAGTFNVAPSGMTVSGNFARSGGSFTPGSSTVTFDNAGIITTISGSTSFYNLTSIIPGKTIKFTNGTTTTVTNTLTLRGSSSGLVTLASTTPSSQWNLTVNGTATLSKLSVQDSNACGGSNSPLVSTGSTNVSGNSCWTIIGYYTGWYNNSWTQRRTITIDHTKVAGDLTDFPVLIKLSSDSSLASNALSNGNDILFTSDDGTTKLPHEIEKYSNSTGALEAWVKIPSLSSTVNTTIYIYYGNAAASNQQDATNVWDSNYKGVWHLPNGTTLTSTDSTVNANNGTATSVDATTGQIDGGALFNASTDKIDVGNNASLRITGDLTVSAWVKAINDPPGADDGHIVSSSHTGTDRGYLIKSSHDLGPQNWAVQISGTGSDAIQRYSNTVRSLGTWYYVVGVYNASGQTLHIYVNGALDDNTLSGTVPASIHSSANNVQFGHDVNDVNMSFDGAIDEVHISTTSRSAAWTLTEYNNQSSPSTFFSISAGIATKPVSSFRGGAKIRGGTSIKSN